MTPRRCSAEHARFCSPCDTANRYGSLHCGGCGVPVAPRATAAGKQASTAWDATLVASPADIGRIEAARLPGRIAVRSAPWLDPGEAYVVNDAALAEALDETVGHLAGVMQVDHVGAGRMLAQTFVPADSVAAAVARLTATRSVVRVSGL